MELMLAILVFLLAVGGLALGIVLSGRPPQSSCGGIDCVPGARCETCPRRVRSDA